MFVAEGVFVPRVVGKDPKKHAGVRDLAVKEGVNRMQFWTYDCREQKKLYHAVDDWPLFIRKMGNFEQSENTFLTRLPKSGGSWLNDNCEI